MNTILDAVLVWWGVVSFLAVIAFFVFLLVSTWTSLLQRRRLTKTGPNGDDV